MHPCVVWARRLRARCSRRSSCGRRCLRKTMKNGQCPKCNSREVYSSIDGGGIGDGFSVQVLDGDSMKSTRQWQTFLCVTCGYYENYLLDGTKIARIVENPQKAGWKKVS